MFDYYDDPVASYMTPRWHGVVKIRIPCDHNIFYPSFRYYPASELEVFHTEECRAGGLCGYPSLGKKQ